MANKATNLSLSDQTLTLLDSLQDRDSPKDGSSRIGKSVVVTRALELYAQAHVQEKTPAHALPSAEKYVLKEDLRPLYDEIGAAAARLLPLIKRLDAIEKTLKGPQRVPPLAVLEQMPAKCRKFLNHEDFLAWRERQEDDWCGDR